MSGGNTLTMEGRVHFQFKPLPRCLQLSLSIYSVCELNARGQIQTHADMWDLKSVVQNVPLLGRLYNVLRPILGSMSSRVIRQVLPERRRSKTDDPVTEES